MTTWIKNDMRACDGAHCTQLEYAALAHVGWPRALKALQLLLDETTCDCGNWPERACESSCVLLLSDRIIQGRF